MRSSMFSSLLAICAALKPTKISIKDCCHGHECLEGTAFNHPATVEPVTPTFDFNVTGKLRSSSGTPTFTAKGSLGLPNHPLGIFGFDYTGDACGPQTFYLEDGVLAAITVNFPACPWSGDVVIAGHADVWTTIPAFPVKFGMGIPTGFTMEVHVAPGNKSAALGMEAGWPWSRKEHLCMKVGLSQPGGEGADPRQDVCNLDMETKPEYPPVPAGNVDDRTISWETLDLDVEPAKRWDHIVKPKAKEIKAMVDQFFELLPSFTQSKLMMTILDLGSERLLKRIPAPYDEEIRGIANSTGLDIVDIFVYNIMYEVMGACTSIVSQDTDGHVYHSRNLDFGIFMGSDIQTHNWALTATLRPLLMNINVVKGGVSLYNMTQYAGYVGLLTGSKTGGFSISVDTRFDAHLDMYLVMWMLGKYDGTFLSFKTRDVMETVGDYPAALHQLTHYKPMGPAYIIIGGIKSGEGAAITLGAGTNEALLVRSLPNASARGTGDASWYVLQTNYDFPGPPPSFDDRRYPAEDCLNKLGHAGVSLENLWAVHSTTPTKNALTTYTTLMSAGSGHFEAYKQFCAPGPNCAPFLNGELFRPISLSTPGRLLV